MERRLKRFEDYVSTRSIDYVAAKRNARENPFWEAVITGGQAVSPRGETLAQCFLVCDDEDKEIYKRVLYYTAKHSRFHVNIEYRDKPDSPPMWLYEDTDPRVRLILAEFWPIYLTRQRFDIFNDDTLIFIELTLHSFLRIRESPMTMFKDEIVNSLTAGVNIYKIGAVQASLYFRTVMLIYHTRSLYNELSKSDMKRIYLQVFEMMRREELWSLYSVFLKYQQSYFDLYYSRMEITDPNDHALLVDSIDRYVWSSTYPHTWDLVSAVGAIPIYEWLSPYVPNPIFNKMDMAVSYYRAKCLLRRLKKGGRFDRGYTEGSCHLLTLIMLIANAKRTSGNKKNYVKTIPVDLFRILKPFLYTF